MSLKYLALAHGAVLFSGLVFCLTFALLLFRAVRRRNGETPASNEHRSFEKKLSSHITLAILCTGVLAVTIISPTFRDLTRARQNLYDIEQYRLLLEAANHLAAERGPANITMSQAPSPLAQDNERLSEFRLRSDAALAALSASAEVPIGLHDQPVPADMLERVHEQLSVARAKVDRIATTSGAPLESEEMQTAIESMFAVSDSLRVIVAWRASDLMQHDAGLAAPVLVGQMLSDLRDYGGRVASQILAPVATQQRLPLTNVIESRQSQGRLIELWHLITSQGALYDNAALAKSRAEIEQRFFGEGLGLIDGLIRDSRSGEGYTMTAAQLTDRFVPTMRPIEAYRSMFLHAAVDEYSQRRDAALTTLGIVALVTGTVLTILVGIIYSIKIRVFRPLLRAHEGLMRLAEDLPPIHQTCPDEPREIRDLFTTLDLLQGKIAERATMTTQLRAEADADGLTALLNRRALDRIAQTLPTMQNANLAVCLVLIDIDHFKHVNDTYGHLTGDRVLIQTAELLRSVLRSGDVIARFGGEEFAILIPGSELSGAIAIARKIRLAIQRERFTTPEGEAFHVTASFGVALGTRGADAWPSLIASADAALYRAKAEGRNRVRFARHSDILDFAPAANDA